MTRPIVIDFETEAIQPRPSYPPKPVGVAIDEPGHPTVYLATGHPYDNNSTIDEMRDRLQAIWRSGKRMMFHNAKFDLDVAETHLGLPLPPWHHVEDTLLLAFLNNPHELNLSLKPLAEKYAGIKPVARDALREWILANVPAAKRAPRTWGAYIALAPGGLVGKYAISDVTMTRKLFAAMRPLTLTDARMREAYDRERRLLPHLLRMETTGVPLAARRLKKDLTTWTTALEHVDGWLRRHLKASDLDVDSNEALANALEAVGAVTALPLTPAGHRSTAMEALDLALTDDAVRGVLRYRARLAVSVRTFAEPWLRIAGGAGRIYTTWNQVRHHTEAGVSRGARTGRLSSTPNFQNVPNQPPPVVFSTSSVPGSIRLPAALRGKATPLPNLRDYFIAPRGFRLNDRDYSQQELRLLAHFEDATLRQAYQDDAALDVHELARKKINELLSSGYSRKPIKTIGFGVIYGIGLGALAVQLGCSVDAARRLRAAYLQILPGVRQLDQDLKQRAANNEPIYTWGGRRYYVEAPKVIKGRMRTFAYKLLNQLIQGSAADVTKEATIRYHEKMGGDAAMILTVHDQLVTLPPAGEADADMRLLREAMESIECDVPMLSTGSTSTQSWGRLKPIKR